MKPGNKNSFNSKSTININNKDYTYYSISEAEKNGLEGVSKLPKSFFTTLNPQLETITDVNNINRNFFWILV